MKAPAKLSEISQDWIQYMLTDYENRENPGTTVTVESFETSQGSELGEGFIGSILKLQVNGKIINVSNSDVPEIKVYDLIIKLKGDDPRISFAFEKAQVYVKEMLFYSKILVELDNFQKSKANNQYPINIPKYVYGKCTEEEFILVMENIKGKGFYVHSSEKTFNYEHLKLAVTQLVRLHAVSYSFNKSYSFLERYPEFKKSDIGTYFLRLANPAILDIQCEILKKEKDGDLAQKIKSNKENLIKQIQEMHNENDYSLLCLVHADPHAKNIMFSYSDGDENHDSPNDIKLLDWQLTHWNTPVMDLQFLIYSSTSRELRNEHLEDILKFYHSTFMEATSNMGVEGLNWSYEDFIKDFNKMALYGLNKGIYHTFLHRCPEYIQYLEDDKQKAMKQSNFMKTLTSPLAKLYKKYFFSSGMNSLMNITIKSSLIPYVKFITNRENEIMSSMILGLISEAEENGLYD